MRGNNHVLSASSAQHEHVYFSHKSIYIYIYMYSERGLTERTLTHVAHMLISSTAKRYHVSIPPKWVTRPPCRSRLQLLVCTCLPEMILSILLCRHWGCRVIVSCSVKRSSRGCRYQSIAHCYIFVELLLSCGRQPAFDLKRKRHGRTHLACTRFPS